MATYKDIKKEFFDLSIKEQEQILKEIYNFSKDIKEFLNTRFTNDNEDYHIEEIESATNYYTYTGIPKILSTRKINSVISKAKKAKVSTEILEKMEYIAFKGYFDSLNDFGDGPEIYEDKIYDHLKNYLTLVSKNNSQQKKDTKLNDLKKYLLENTNMYYDHIWELFEEMTNINLR